MHRDAYFERKTLYSAIAVSAVSLFASTYSCTFLTSYLPEMTLWLGGEERQKGYYVAIVTTSFYVGAFLTSYAIGWLFDKLEHRRILISLLLANGLFAIILSLSISLYMVVAANFLLGTCMSILSVAKAILSIYSDNATQVLAMSMLQIAYGIGLNSGAAVGGYLSSPAIKYPKVFSRVEFFSRFPYFIPPFSAAVISIISAAFVWFFYPQYDEIVVDIVELVGKTTSNNGNIPTTSTAGHDLQATCYTYTEPVQETSLVDSTHLRRGCSGNAMHSASDCTGEPDSIDQYHLDASPDMPQAEATKRPGGNNAIKRFKRKIARSTFVSLIKNKDVMKCIVMMVLSNTMPSLYNDMFALWASTDNNFGGLGYSTEQIATVVMIAIIPCVILQALISSAIARRIGSIWALIVYTMLLCIVITLVPLIRFLRDSYTEWIVAIVFQTVAITCDIAIGIYVGILINNSVPVCRIGAVNGLSRTAFTLGRSICSLISGVIFTTSITSSFGTPIDSSLVFVWMGFHLWCSAIITYFIPRKFNFQNVDSN